MLMYSSGLIPGGFLGDTQTQLPRLNLIHTYQTGRKVLFFKSQGAEQKHWVYLSDKTMALFILLYQVSSSKNHNLVWREDERCPVCPD